MRWPMWVSTTDRHRALRCGILTAAQIAAGVRQLLWDEDSAGLAAQIGAQDELLVTLTVRDHEILRDHGQI